MRVIGKSLLSLIAGLLVFVSASSQAETQDTIVVTGVTPLTQGNAGALSVQKIDDELLSKGSQNSIADFLDHHMSGVTINHAQNNPLQPDVQFRGFSSSPLLGLPQGMAVFQNGARINEPFGDTVNWDLIASNTISDVYFISGSNPVFGLNALGGALVVNTKNGFDNVDREVSVSAGSFSRKTASFNLGNHSDNFAYYVALNAFDEDGYRDASESEAVNFYSALSWQLGDSRVHLYYNHADTDLIGNGAAPIELLAQDRNAVFTHPDQTENNMDMLNLTFEKQLSSTRQLNASVFYRRNKTDSFNGDGTSFGECEENEGFLCVGDDDDDDDDGDAAEEVASNDDDDDDDEEEILVYDQNGQLVSEEFNAINNISDRKQESFGLNLQIMQQLELANATHNLIAGVNYLQGTTRFNSTIEFAALNEDRSTTRTGLFDANGDTNLRSETKSYGLYLSDTIELSDQWQLGLSARYDYIDIESRDASGARPELDADHSFDRLNFGLNSSYQFTDDVIFFASASQSMRAPSPVELACSHPEAPCTLPNTFLADPPLDEVLSTTYELGLKGTGETINQWHVGVFNARNDNDILFQSTGGVSSNVGFFDNVGDTLRQGAELRLRGKTGPMGWFVNYAYLKATFEDDFVVSSPNHPQSEDGGLEVQAGDQIPGLPEHNLVFGVSYDVSDKLVVSSSVEFNSGQYLRGDEANLEGKTDAYGVVDLELEYQMTKNLSFDVTVQNLFDEEYESFGLFGEPDEIFEEFSDPRFLSVGAPRGAWVKVSYKW